MADRKRLINLHTSTANNMPVGRLSLGEIAVEHSSVEGAKLYVETQNGSSSSGTIATFITEKAIDTKIASAVNGLTNIVDALTDVVLTGASGDTIITATVNNPDVSANTLSISHKTATTITDTFQKITTDGYGHVTGGTAVAIGDITGLTGWEDAVKAAETKLSTGATTGNGNALTAFTVNDHEITGVLGGPFAESAHTHSGADITSGTVGIAYLPTATTVNSSSDDTTVPTSKAVNDAIDNALTSTMDYKGATSALPGGETKIGDVYIASSQIAIPAGSSATGAAVTAETGDYIVARTSGATGAAATWDVIEKNLDGAVTSTGMTADQIVVANGANTIISKDPASLLVGSASTVPLAGVTDADDLKAIEALTGTSGVLTKTAADTWKLQDVVTTVGDYSGLTQSGSLIDAYVVKQVIDENELVTAEALNDLNTRTNTLSATTNNLDTRVTVLEQATPDYYATAITINNTSHTVSANTVDLGNYLSGSTQYISDISQVTTASAITTTFTIANPTGGTSSYDVVEDIIIDCGTY